VQGAGTASRAELTRQREVVDPFLAALRSGDFEALVAVLDPDVVVRVDSTSAAPGAPRESRGARTWAKGAIAFSRHAWFHDRRSSTGRWGVVMAPRGRLFRALSFTIARGKIVQIDVVADPERLRQLDLAVLND